MCADSVTQTQKEKSLPIVQSRDSPAAAARLSGLELETTALKSTTRYTSTPCVGYFTSLCIHMF